MTPRLRTAGRRTPRRLKQEIAPQLGEWPAASPDNLLAAEGVVADPLPDGMHVHCSFVHTDTGLMSMTRWLCAQGASDVRYEIYGTPILKDTNAREDAGP